MSSLEPAQFAALNAQCCLIPSDERDVQHALLARDWLDPACCKDILQSLTPVIGSPSLRITASLLSKRLAFLTTAVSAYAMSAYDRGLNLSVDNVYLEYGHREGVWQSRLPLRDLSVTTPALAQRETWRQQLMQQLFAQLLAPLWHSFAAASKVPLPVLWENTAVRVYSLYERRLAKIDCPQRQAVIRADFHYLLHHAPTQVFGIKENPLARNLWPKQLLTPDAPPVRFRKTCCYYHKASTPQEFCTVCPLLRPKTPKRAKPSLVHKESLLHE